MYLRNKELWFESRVIAIQQNILNLHVRKLKRHGCNNIYVFISVLQLLTLSGRFRVVFGVGHDRALTFRNRSWIFEF